MILRSNSEDYYSQSYDEARTRFIAAAKAAGAQLNAYPLAAASALGGDLNIDVAQLGAADAPTLIVSSGVHGIEGFFGSAVQLALLEHLAPARARAGLRLVLIHALNPYGFKHLRRVNEHNVDLNRNFLLSAAEYHGAPHGYARLEAFLNPPSRPTRLERFRLKAAWHIWRQGLETVKNTVAGGQYEYPRGLFYGGSGPTASTRVVVEHCDAWIGEAQDLLHIDLHTGLGGYALPTLLVHDTAESPRYAWYAQTFGADNVEPLARSKGTAYRANGVFGQWMKQHFAARNYRFAGAEFGTYPILRVLSAIRAENRAHHYCTPEDPAILRSKLELLECFCPQASQWRHDALSAALRILERGINALREPKSAPVAQPA